MATAIRNIPVLRGDAAALFEKRAKDALEKRGTVDCRERSAIAKAILRKAKIWG